MYHCVIITREVNTIKMNIDKFGHHVHKRLRQSQNKEGDIDLHHARLKGLNSPRTSDEAVNKAYVDKLIKLTLTRQEFVDELAHLKKDIDSLVVRLKTNYFTKDEITKISQKVLKV